jgi:hypothetical protein
VACTGGLMRPTSTLIQPQSSRTIAMKTSALKFANANILQLRGALLGETVDRPLLDKWAEKHGQGSHRGVLESKNRECLNGEDTGIFGDTCSSIPCRFSLLSNVALGDGE